MSAEPAEHTATDVVRRDAPVWAWLRRQFGLRSLAAGLLGASVWIWNQHADIEDLKKRDPTKQLDRIEESQRETLRQIATLQADMTNVAARVTRQEAQWDRVTQVAEAPPRRRR